MIDVWLDGHAAWAEALRRVPRSHPRFTEAQAAAEFVLSARPNPNWLGSVRAFLHAAKECSAKGVPHYIARELVCEHDMSSDWRSGIVAISPARE